VEDQARIQPGNFFRARLLTLTTQEQLEDFIGNFEKDAKALRKEIVEIMWYMRGSLSRNEAWCLSPTEREEYANYIGERMKIVEKTKMALI
jgi:hypothetical protein